VLGLVDDRRSLGPRIKLLTQFTVAAILAGPLDIRIFELLETYGAPGIAASIAISCLWMVAITNAVNMLDNMDGLAAGVSAVIAATYLAATLIGQQWFVASLCALLLGALVGFLAFNYPRARLYMGDGGSLVVGMLLAVISIRTTYFNPDTRIATDTHWYVVLMPLVVMAVPLYDLISVCVVRLRAGRSPFVGDQNHFSHRLVRRGMSRPAAVALIWLITLATSLGGVMFTTLAPWQAVLVAVQTAAMIAVLALLDFGPGEPGH
ncbi:MAG: undecaprenyl-phosphate alpha-N-acetylglucosaminyl 1-phosphate transferase, partial [Phycisphaeraceae bacterium]|nr:undecaprenyl-phosphate alpha-N-acetylglucosaminyl 1-phosphate transferase [Phycisphaeraceae bacterium]